MTHAATSMRSRLACAAALALLAVSDRSAPANDVDPRVLEAEQQRIEMLERVYRATVAVLNDDGQNGGSGVVISADGFALSNFHVTSAVGTAMRCGMNDGRLYDAVIVGIDPVGDVALIKLFGRDDFPHAELGDSDQVRAGDWVFAVGNPFLLATDFQPTVTYGIVSGVHRYQYPAGTLLEYADCIQTDAAINPGNSGGPLFDSQGRLVGINGRGSFEKRGRVSVGVGYSISINQIKNFLGCLKAGRIVDHATLGAVVSTSASGTPVVTDILDDSDAYRRGLRYGDEIVALGGRSVRTANAVKNALGIFPKGWRIPLSYRRDGATHDILVRLAGVHSSEELLAKIAGRPEVEPPLPPSDPPRDGDPPERQDEQPPPRRGRAAGASRDKAMPAIVEKHFVERRGFANYYFNTLHRDRVWKAFVDSGQRPASAADWTITGELSTGGDALFRLTDTSARCQLPGGDLSLELGDDLAATAAAEPTGHGGMLAALFLWRRLAVLGPDEYGDVTYYGQMPLAGHDEPVDVLVGNYGGAECQFLFDASSHRLLAIELFLDPAADPCEIRLIALAERGAAAPRAIEVRYGDRLFAAWRINEFKTDASDVP